MQEKAIFITTGLTHGTLSVFILFICGFFFKKKNFGVGFPIKIYQHQREECGE